MLGNFGESEVDTPISSSHTLNETATSPAAMINSEGSSVSFTLNAFDVPLPIATRDHQTANAQALVGREFFPDLISGPFHHGLVVVFVGTSSAILVQTPPSPGRSGALTMVFFAPRSESAPVPG